MHQSLMFSIQWRYVFLYFAGMNLMASSMTARVAGFAISSIDMNHCIESLGSIATPVRSE